MAGTQINLPPDLAAKLEERVASGAAHDLVQVVREGVAALEAEDARKLEAIRAKLSRSINDPRPSLDGEEVFDRIEKMLSERP